MMAATVWRQEVVFKTIILRIVDVQITEDDAAIGDLFKFDHTG